MNDPLTLTRKQPSGAKTQRETMVGGGGSFTPSGTGQKRAKKSHGLGLGFGFAHTDADGAVSTVRYGAGQEEITLIGHGHQPVRKTPDEKCQLSSYLSIRLLIRD